MSIGIYQRFESRQPIARSFMTPKTPQDGVHDERVRQAERLRIELMQSHARLSRFALMHRALRAGVSEARLHVSMAGLIRSVPVPIKRTRTCKLKRNGAIEPLIGRMKLNGQRRRIY
jgi:hypothetical protein